MPSESEAIGYWNDVADEKNFTFPVDIDLLTSHLDTDHRIFDLGCGYGRVTSLMQGRGFTDVTGFDPAPAMIERGRNTDSALDLRVWRGERLPVEDESIDGVLLVGVLSCIPDDHEQIRLLNEVRRVLKNDGYVYISDIPIQHTERYQRRYSEFSDDDYAYGTFRLPDGGLLRHLKPSRFEELLGGLDLLHRRR
ncbi:MAG: class I SAM-dependent methyltransferase, partial [Persicimonas sp.]